MNKSMVINKYLYMKKGKDMHKYITANVKTRNIYISKTKN